MRSWIFELSLADASCLTTASASPMCLVALSCESQRSRMIPPRSITKVTRPAMRPSVFLTPNARAPAPPGSDSSVNGRLWWRLKPSCDAASSADTPTTSAPASTKSW
jgi:hypothetical protein